MKIGIARGLLFYRYYPFWTTFFEELGIEVVVSPETTKSILEDGLRMAVDEICLPVKTFHGHIKYLIDKVDYVFLPRIVSVEPKRYKRYTCPKFIGLPDMIRGAFDDLPGVIEVEVDLMKEPMIRSYKKLGNKLGYNKSKVENALTKASATQSTYERLILKAKYPDEAQVGSNISKFQLRQDNSNRKDNGNLGVTVALVSHPYILFDYYISGGILWKLCELKVKVITSFSFPRRLIEQEMSKYKEVSWGYEREIIGSISYYLRTGSVDGIIYLVSFGCGPGSIVREIILREIEGSSCVPFLTLIMDEHTGESGILTRIEAFLDTIRMRKR